MSSGKLSKQEVAAGLRKLESRCLRSGLQSRETHRNESQTYGRVLCSKRIRLTLDRNSHFDLSAERIRDQRRVQTRAHQVLDCIIFSRLYEAR